LSETQCAAAASALRRLLSEARGTLSLSL